MKILYLQCISEMKRVLRNRYYVFWSLAMPIFFYYIYTKVVNTHAPDVKAWQAHYLMSMTAFSVMGTSIMTLGIRMVQENTQGWSLFIRLTPLSDRVYFAGQIIGQSVIHLLSIIVIFLAGAIMNHVSLSPFEWIMSGLWILLAAMPFMALGTLIGLMKKVETASGISNLIYLALAITGGMWTPIEMMPKTMQMIGHLLPSYHFGNGAWEIVNGGEPSWKNILSLIAYLALFIVLSKYIRRKQEAM